MEVGLEKPAEQGGFERIRATFKSFWSRDQAEVERARAQASQKLEEIRAEAQKQRELEIVKAEAEAARTKLRGLQSREGWRDLEYELRYKVENRQYSYLPGSAEELRKDKADTEAIVAEVETTLVETRHKREEEAKAKAEAERAEREELSPILNETENIQEARTIRSFAEYLEKKLGSKRAVDVLRGELNAPYGRARRQGAIRHAVPELEDSESRDFLWFQNASRVDLWIAGALAWLEARQTPAKIEPEPLEVGPPAPAGTLDISKLFGGQVRQSPRGKRK